MAYHQPFEITGFHSCDKEVGIKLLNGELQLLPSKNPWDWLGWGIYFWEQNPERAVQYALECAKGEQKNKKRIRTPFVIGSAIELGNCLNLLDPKAMEIIVNAHESLLEMVGNSSESMPVNDGPKRNLDCAVIKTVHEMFREKGLQKFDTVRCAFAEGKEAYAGSNFSMRGHIEICVINPDMIKGYFLPRPLERFNPYLKKDFIPKPAA